MKVFNHQNRDRIHSLAILGILTLVLSISCEMKEPENTRSNAGASASSVEEDDDESVSLPSNVSGAYLTCQFIEESPDPGKETLGCNVNLDDSVIRPASFADSWQWDVTASFDNSGEVDVSIQDLRDQEGEFEVLYEFRANSGEIVNHDVLRARVDFSFNTAGDSETYFIRKRVQDILSQLEQKQYLRLSIASVMTQSNDPYQRIDLIEIKVDGKWYVVSGAELTSLNPRITIGEGADEIAEAVFPLDPALLNDVVLLSNAVSDWGEEENAGLAGTRFSEAPPHDASEPFLVDFTFNKPVTIQGLRFDEGKLGSGINATGAPDQLHLEVSDDGQSWTYVSGSDVSAAAVVSVVNMLWGR